MLSMNTRSRSGKLPAKVARLSPTRGSSRQQQPQAEQSIPLLELLRQLPPLRQALVEGAGASEQACYEATLSIASLDVIQQLHTRGDGEQGAYGGVIQELWDALAAKLPAPPTLTHHGWWQRRIPERLGLGTDSPGEELKAYQVARLCRAVGMKSMPQSKAAMLVRGAVMLTTVAACMPVVLPCHASKVCMHASPSPTSLQALPIPNPRRNACACQGRRCHCVCSSPSTGTLTR